ncbi:MAG: ABC transporter ATP-binding protein [Rhizobiaceae bacterium]|nr:ABC transporter ATP-binding protein [Rhizobiaceae bacterium]
MSTVTNRQTATTAKRLVVKNLNKSFGNVHVVRDLNLDVEPGEFLVLLGPSGCGKTTALRMIAGLEEADSGSIVLGDADVTTTPPKYRDVAMVFQSYALYPHKTVAENIGFPLKMQGLEKPAINKAVHEAAEQVQMESLLERYPRQLSGGQRQRVALARAIIRRPSVFLMDEPLSNLDARLRSFMRTELKHMQHELGVTTLYVTHDQIEAMTLAHRVAIMSEGVLQQLGTPHEVYNDPANLFVASFMGSPPMNFIEGKITDKKFQSEGVDLFVAGAKNTKNVTIGFRPEDTKVVVRGKGLFDAKIYAVEMTGDQTLVTIQMNETTMIVKMPKDFDAEIDKEIGVSFEPEQGYFFDTDTGERLRSCTITKKTKRKTK